MEIERMLPENTLENNNSYNLYSRFRKGSDLFKTGFTGTNVMDLHLIYIKKRNCKCKLDIEKEILDTEKEIFDNTLDAHDLHIDPSTIETHKDLYKQEYFEWKKFLEKPEIMIKKDEQLNIKIIDDNLRDPCCRRDRKFPLKNLLKDKDFPS